MYILNKSKNATPELFTIYIQNDQASKANDSVSKCSKTGLCITVKVLRMFSQGKDKSHKNVTGVQFFK